MLRSHTAARRHARPLLCVTDQLLPTTIGHPLHSLSLTIVQNHQFELLQTIHRLVPPQALAARLVCGLRCLSHKCHNHHFRPMRSIRSIYSRAIHPLLRLRDSRVPRMLPRLDWGIRPTMTTLMRSAIRPSQAHLVQGLTLDPPMTPRRKVGVWVPLQRRPHATRLPLRTSNPHLRY